MSIEIKYSDIAIGSKQAFVPVSSEKQDFIDLSQLQQDDLVFTNFASFGELNNVMLDDSQTFLPVDKSGVNFGLWSLQQSGSDKNFDTPIILELTASSNFSSTGITLTFDEDVNAFATDVNIKWYRDNTLLEDEDFEIDSAVYFCNKTVASYNKLVITFYSMNMPYVYLKLRAIDFGVIRIFKDSELINLSIIQELNPISTEISINTMDFTLASKNDVEFIFQNKQPLNVKFNGKQIGTFFINGSERTAKNRWKIESEDYIGLLDKITFMGGMYSNKNAVELLQELFTIINAEYEIDESLDDEIIDGYIPICTGRDALMQIAFVIGAVVDTSNSNKIKVMKPQEEISSVFDLDRIIQGQKFKQNDKVTKLNLTINSYNQTNNEITLYDASQNQIGNNILVTFSGPMYNLSITNGTILSSGTNYAYINANNGCVLKGKEIENNQTIIEAINPTTLAGDIENVVTIADATLVNKTNANTIIERIAPYIFKEIVCNAKLKIENEECGDMITIKSDYRDDFDGNIVSMRYKLISNVIVADCEVK